MYLESFIGEERSGVYKITCLATLKIYIGSTYSFYYRWYEHLRLLELKQHHSSHLQNSFNKYGRLGYKTEVIEYCDLSDLISREQYYLDTLLYAQEYIKRKDNRFFKLGYNISPTAGSNLGYKKTKEQLDKISGEKHHMYGKSHSKETKEKISNSSKGRKISKETRLKISKSHTGKKLKTETRRKLSILNSGDKCRWFGKEASLEERARISKVHKGKVTSQETKDKISKSKQGCIPPNRKIVTALNLEKGVFMEFISLKLTSVEFGTHRTRIAYYIKHNKPYKNHLFFYS